MTQFLKIHIKQRSKKKKKENRKEQQIHKFSVNLYYYCFHQYDSWLKNKLISYILNQT